MLIADDHYETKNESLRIYSAGSENQTAYYFSSNDAKDWEKKYGVSFLSCKSHGVNTELPDLTREDMVQNISDGIWKNGYCIRTIWSEVEFPKPYFNSESLPLNRRNYGLNVIAEKSNKGQAVHKRSSIDRENLNDLISKGKFIRGIGIRKYVDFKDGAIYAETSDINYENSYKEFFVVSDKYSKHQFFIMFGREEGCLDFSLFKEVCSDSSMLGYHLSYIFFDPFNEIYFVFFDTNLKSTTLANIFALLGDSSCIKVREEAGKYLAESFNEWKDLEGIEIGNAFSLVKSFCSFEISKSEEILKRAKDLINNEYDAQEKKTLLDLHDETYRLVSNYRSSKSHKIKFVSDGQYCQYCGETNSNYLNKLTCYNRQGHKFVWNGGNPRCNKCGKSHIEISDSSNCIG